jgi:hypothetical protein
MKQVLLRQSLSFSLFHARINFGYQGSIALCYSRRIRYLPLSSTYMSVSDGPARVWLAPIERGSLRSKRSAFFRLFTYLVRGEASMGPSCHLGASHLPDLCISACMLQSWLCMPSLGSGLKGLVHLGDPRQIRS